MNMAVGGGILCFGLDSVDDNRAFAGAISQPLIARASHLRQSQTTKRTALRLSGLPPCIRQPDRLNAASKPNLSGGAFNGQSVITLHFAVVRSGHYRRSSIPLSISEPPVQCERKCTAPTRSRKQKSEHPSCNEPENHAFRQREKRAVARRIIEMARTRHHGAEELRCRRLYEHISSHNLAARMAKDVALFSLTMRI
jgi:hypothetical protein